MTSGNRRIRVLHLGSPTGLYGAERWILALLRYLPSDSVTSIVGTIKDEPGIEVAPICEEAEARGLETVHFESIGKLSWSAIRQIREFIVAWDVDIVHTHGYKTDIIGAFATSGTSCRIVSTPHGWSVNAGWKLQAYEWLDRVAFRFMDAVVPLSEDLYAGLSGIKALDGKLHLILNGVDLSEIDAAEPTQDPSLETTNADFVFGYIGQLITRKRIDTLIAAFERLELPGKKLWIVGEGPQRSDLESLAGKGNSADKIKFLGFRSDRLELLKRFDTFVLPSSLEGIPRCLMEALGARTPVIASDIPGCDVLIEDGVTGLLFACGDAEGLHDAM